MVRGDYIWCHTLGVSRDKAAPVQITTSRSDEENLACCQPLAVSRACLNSFLARIGKLAQHCATTVSAQTGSAGPIFESNWPLALVL